MPKVGDLSKEQVVHIKQCMLKGMGNSQLARLYQRSEQTMGRIRRGLSHIGVKVDGEEALRAGEDGEVAVVAPGVPETKEVLDRMAEESLGRLQKLLGGDRVKEVAAAPTASRLEGLPAELREKAERLLGLRVGGGEAEARPQLPAAFEPMDFGEGESDDEEPDGEKA